MTTDSVTRITGNFREGAQCNQLGYFIYNREGVAQLEMTLHMPATGNKEFDGTREDGLKWLSRIIAATDNSADVEFLRERHEQIAACPLPEVTSRVVPQIPRTEVPLGFSSRSLET